METLYFLVPIVATVALLSLFIARMNDRSYLRRRIETRYSGGKQPGSEKQLCPRERLEQRYVDWFTREDYGHARKRSADENEEDFLVRTAYMAGGVSYRPEFSSGRMAG